MSHHTALCCIFATLRLEADDVGREPSNPNSPFIQPADANPKLTSEVCTERFPWIIDDEGSGP
jgi:hypothetical protein